MSKSNLSPLAVNFVPHQRIENTDHVSDDQTDNILSDESIVSGQFDDALDDPDSLNHKPDFVNMNAALESLDLFDDEDDEDLNLLDSDENYENDPDLLLNYGDQWFQSSGDFTKQYNKLRNQITPSPAYKQPEPSNSLKPSTQEKHLEKPTRSVAIKGQVTSKAAQEATLHALDIQFQNRIKLDVYDVKLPTNPSIGGSRKAEGEKQRNTDKSDRATVEQVLDPRTRLILFKLLNSNAIHTINGCISTGKEANVYHASTSTGEHRAIKVYKTSILVFKDRDRYVAGEFRFRHGYNKSNPRKMVKLWAEKEMRNLKRLWGAGVPCPEPLVLRMHVLVMTFIGAKSGWAAPRLKDAVIDDAEDYRDLYFQLIKIMWIMYRRCRLVHADLSEYNILYHNGKLVIIDVSQAVEHDHPHALEFLRKDCINVIDYFKRILGPHTIMTLRELFDFVVTDRDVLIRRIKQISTPADVAGLEELLAALEKLKREDLMRAADDRMLDLYLEIVHKEIEQRPELYLESVQVDEEVFKRSYIPRTLDQVEHFERDAERLKSGQGDQILYTSVTGLSLSTTNLPIIAPTLAAFLSSIPVAPLNMAGASDSIVASPLGQLAMHQPRSDSVMSDQVPLDTDDDGMDGDRESATVDSLDADTDSNIDSGSGSENGEEDADDEDTEQEGRRKVMKKDEDKNMKKDRKKAVKEEKKEKRKVKVPKAVKKRRQKVSADRAKK
ncbi:Serine/threonine-protein kinase RIO1 [Nowakowskiella sp. JEL0078]|nr:Serine/threonine-protein kinase RIO1 [Nowakowskiella sp. JEL0078]